MWQLILGTAGFVLYFVYDINSVLSKNVCLQKFFAWGSILVVASVVAEFCSAWGQGHRSVEAVIGFGIGALFFLGLLIYTLFFALPFEETYCEENKLRAVCAVIRVYCGLQVPFYACGECWADGDRESILDL